MSTVILAGTTMSTSGRKRPELRRSPVSSRMTVFLPLIAIMAISWLEGRTQGACMQRSWVAGMAITRAKPAPSTSRPRGWAFTTPRRSWRGTCPLAAGAAYAAKARKARQLAVCLFGDGALEEGAAPETFNIASLWRLPMLFLCENNGKYGAHRAVGAAQSTSMAAYPLTELPKLYRIPAAQVDGTDTSAVYSAVSEAVAKIRREKDRSSSRRTQCAGQEARATGLRCLWSRTSIWPGT